MLRTFLTITAAAIFAASANAQTLTASGMSGPANLSRVEAKFTAKIDSLNAHVSNQGQTITELSNKVENLETMIRTVNKRLNTYVAGNVSNVTAGEDTDTQAFPFSCPGHRFCNCPNNTRAVVASCEVQGATIGRATKYAEGYRCAAGESQVRTTLTCSK